MSNPGGDGGPQKEKVEKGEQNSPARRKKGCSIHSTKHGEYAAWDP